MKRNVDLTENMDFSRKRIISQISALFEHKYKWNFDKESLGSHDVSELILTGNKTTRKHKKKYDLFESGVQCERCGKVFSNKKWNMIDLLCIKCYERLENRFKRKNDIFLNNFLYSKNENTEKLENSTLL